MVKIGGPKDDEKEEAEGNDPELLVKGWVRRCKGNRWGWIGHQQSGNNRNRGIVSTETLACPTWDVLYSLSRERVRVRVM
jgi:hypothetical protein